MTILSSSSSSSSSTTRTACTILLPSIRYQATRSTIISIPQTTTSIRHQSNTSTSSSFSNTNSNSISTIVQSTDYSSYLAHYFYPRNLQPHYLAIRAFNSELASIKDSVSSEILGRIRIGWWRDAIAGAFDNRPAKHPVVLALRDAIQDPNVLSSGGLVEDHFLRIIQAREDDLASPFTPPTLSDLELYSEATSSRLFYLYLNLIGVNSTILDELFSHLGKANGLTLSLASIPFHAQLQPSTTSSSTSSPQGGGLKPSPRNTITKGQRRLMIPSEFLFKHNVVEEEVYRKGMDANGFKDSVFETATRANDYLITARTIIKEEFGGKIPEAVVGPLVGAVPSKSYLQRLESLDFDVFQPSLQQRYWKLPWEMVES